MINDAPSLDSWIFEDIETGLRAYAESQNKTYDKYHPVSCLPDGSTQAALRHLGVTYAQVSKWMNTGYQTVAGWFNTKRNPSRSTFKYSIYPALCESYRRTTSLSVSSDFERKGVERRVFLLLTTGSTDTPEEIQERFEKAKERFQRSAIAYAASKLNKVELASIAQGALGFLALNHDQVLLERDFYWHNDSRSSIYELSTVNDGLGHANALENAAYEMSMEAWRNRVTTLSDEELRLCANSLTEEIERRKQELPPVGSAIEQAL